MNEITTFDFESQAVRSVLIEGEPWFVAVDVCRILELSNPSMALQSLDEDERSKFNLGRQGKTNIINESGMYILVMRSHDAVKEGTLPHRFRKWVTSEVLPALRKNGHYEMAPAPAQMTEPPIDEVLKAWAAVNHCSRLMGKKAARVYMKRFAELPRRDDLLADSGSPVRQFLKEMLEPDESARLQSSLIYELYGDWCAAQGLEQMSQTRFGRQLGALGVQKQASNGKIFRLGWRVKGVEASEVI